VSIYDEEGYEAAAQFLDGWVSVAVRELTALLGHPSRPADVNVVLSATVNHQRRFPPEEEDVTTLMGSEDENMEEQSPKIPLAQRFPPETYAHGVTALCDPDQQPPEGIPVGAPVIYLDIPTIAALASEHRVSEEAMLGRVLLHELSHVLRGHAHQAGKATHGYVCEGDAQRDSWQVLADLLADPEWECLAREARAAQVRLAATQPAAYRQFGQSSPDTGRWNHQDPALNHWILRPARDLLPLSQPAIIEVPFFVRNRFFPPMVGDHVYLYEGSVIVGPWVVIGRANVSHAGHPKDQRAVEVEERRRKEAARFDKSAKDGHRPLEWLHLRRSREMRAGDNSVLHLISDRLEAQKINGNDISLLKNAITGAARDVLETLASSMRQGYETSVMERRELMRAAGKPIPPEPASPYDPYED
jgi:hypothetical protein